RRRRDAEIVGGGCLVVEQQAVLSGGLVRGIRDLDSRGGVVVGDDGDAAAGQRDGERDAVRVGGSVRRRVYFFPPLLARALGGDNIAVEVVHLPVVARVATAKHKCRRTGVQCDPYHAVGKTDVSSDKRCRANL